MVNRIRKKYAENSEYILKGIYWKKTTQVLKQNTVACLCNLKPFVFQVLSFRKHFLLQMLFFLSSLTSKLKSNSFMLCICFHMRQYYGMCKKYRTRKLKTDFAIGRTVIIYSSLEFSITFYY